MQCNTGHFSPVQYSAVQFIDVKIESMDYLELATCPYPSDHLYGCICACVSVGGWVCVLQL